MNLQVYLFGQPRVLLNGEDIIFPYKKAEALFYYMMIKKKIDRNHAFSLFWGDVSEEKARKNLRNAVYIIKKVLDHEVIVSPSRDMLKLNDSLELYLDYNNFMSKDDKEAIELYKGELMQGFLVKDADLFEEWLYSMRYQVREQYIEKLNNTIKDVLEDNNLNLAERLCKRLIGVDDFNEQAYRVLMDIYRKQGKYSKCIEEFNHVARLLDKELSIKPDIKTRRLFEEIMKERVLKVEAKHDNNTFFYGRMKELSELNSGFVRFSKDVPCKSFLINGEIGIGKTSLIHKLIDSNINSDVCFIKAYCHRNEDNVPLKPWYEPISQIRQIIDSENISILDVHEKIIGSIFPSFYHNEVNKDQIPLLNKYDFYQYQVAERAIIDTILTISQKRRIVFVFEDIQRIDSMSLNLIKNIILKDTNKTVLLIMSMTSIYKKDIEIFLTELRKYDLIDRITLNRFSRHEVSEYSSKYNGYEHYDEKLQEYIYKESEGNPLYLTEILKTLKQHYKNQDIPPKIKDIFKAKYLTLSENAKKIVDIASVFNDKFSFDALLQISGKNDFELLEIIEEIQNENIIHEERKNEYEVYFKFFHQKLREFIYTSLSKTKQKLIHRKLGEYYLNQLSNSNKDRLIYPKLIHHYKEAGDKLTYLQFKIKNIYDDLEMNHEIFPIIKNKEIINRYNNFKVNETKILKELNEIESLFNEISDVKTEVLDEIEISYLNMISRYNIVIGKKELGYQLTESMIKKAVLKGQTEYVLKGYKQIVFQCINSRETEQMSEIIRQAIDLARKHNLKEDLGVFVRLKGYLLVLQGNFERGESFLNNAIRIFQSLDNQERYILNIVAVYFYLGESRRLQGDLDKAIFYYNKSIEICEEYGFIGRLTLLNTSMGQAYCENNNLEKSREYFKRAVDLYEKLEFHWGKSVAYSYWALLCIVDGKIDKGIRYLEKSENHQGVLNSSYEREVIVANKLKIEKLLGRKLS